MKMKTKSAYKTVAPKFALPFSDEKTIRSVAGESKLDATAEAVLDAKSKDEVLKMPGSTNV